MGRLRSDMDYTEISDIIEQGLHEYIDRFQRQLNQVGAAIREDFFTSKPVPQSGAMAQRQRQ